MASSRCADDRCVARVHVERAEPLQDGGAVLRDLDVRLWARSAWVPGERIRAIAGLGPPVRFRNPGVPERPQAPPVPSGSVLGAGAVQVLQPAFPRRWLEHARAHVRAALTRSTGAEALGIARALVLGESGALNSGQRDAVRGAGLAHLVAVSGLHMALLAGLSHGLCLWIARRTRWVDRVPAPRLAALSGLLLLPLVVAFTGAAPSARRAGLTVGLGWLATLCGRRAEPARVCCVAVLACLASEPQLARAPGFLLSVAAAASLTRAGQSDLEAASRGALRASLRASGRTWLATLPVALSAFGWSSPWGLVSNLLAVPFASLVWVPLALAHAAAASAHPYLATWTAVPFETACDVVLGLCDVLPATPGAAHVAPLSPVVLGALLLASAVCLWGGDSRARYLVAATCVTVACLVQQVLHAAPGAGEVEVVFLDVGQGDAAVVRTGAGQVALFDVGGRVAGHGPDPGERAVLPWLAAHGIDRVNLVVLSHPHPDHVGGLPAVLSGVRVDEIWDTGQAEDEDPEGPLSHWLSAARAAGTRVRGPADLCRDAPFPLGEARLRVLAPCPAHDPGYGPNDNSLVVELTHGQRRLLFVGDAEQAQERAMWRTEGLLRTVDVLKVGHHGSRTSSHRPMLRRISPRVAVVSCGRHNTFGHPHPEALARLKAEVPHVLRTDLRGGIRVWTDGKALRVGDREDAERLSFPGAPTPAPRRRSR